MRFSRPLAVLALSAGMTFTGAAAFAPAALAAPSVKSGRARESRALTALTIPVVVQTVEYGTTVKVVTGTLSTKKGPLADKEVEWYYRDLYTTKWKHGGTIKTNSEGVAALKKKVTHDRDYTLRYKGSKLYKSSEAVGYSTARTSPRPTSIDLTASPTRYSDHVSVDLVGVVTSHGQPLKKVSLQVYTYNNPDNPNDVADVRTVKTDSDGIAELIVSQTTTSRYEFVVDKTVENDVSFADVTVS